ncbi:MAG TPA: hypothetical protein DDX98_14115 [Bacteroidales bacterium]|jgi:two-component system LytT family sensor kinase|nr:hypothetical protein [Bacteroidales bacterium]
MKHLFVVMTRKNSNKILVTVAIFLSVIVIPTLIIYIFEGNRLFSSWLYYWHHASYGLSFGLVFWLGNWAIGHFTATRLNWYKDPSRSNTISVIAFIVYGIIAGLGVPLILGHYMLHITGKQLINHAVFNAFIALSIDLVVVAVYFSRFLTKAMMEAIEKGEQLEKVNLIAKYEALKNQVNPHFLFNSLNTLAGVVEQDQKKAVDFIKRLSNTYRYVLDQRDKELIAVEKELRFVNDFMHLAKLRHGEGLILNTAVNSVQKQIVPLGIQILVENCIKHNIIEDDFPLTIDILEEDDYLIVKNNLQKKKSIQSTVPLGLENLKNRYSLLSNVPVVVTETPDTFVVKIPMLNTNAE